MQLEIEMRAHRPERRRRFVTSGVLACCSCCCCCCLHTLGSIVGAIKGAGVSGSLETRAQRERRQERERQEAIAESSETDPVIDVLAHYQLAFQAEMATRAGKVGSKANNRFQDHLSRIVVNRWLDVFPGREAETCAWALERIPYLIAEGVLPGQCRSVLVERLKRRVKGAPKEFTPGPLASLWHLHSLYLEMADAVEAGDIPERVLPAIRDALHKRVAATAQSVADRAGETNRPYPTDAMIRANQIWPSMAKMLELPEMHAVFDGMNALLPALPGTIPAQVSEIPDATLGLARGVCAVCGDGIAGWPTVLCAACETPHHRDCWSYNRRCAMFACGCADTLGADGTAPRRIRYRFDRAPEKRPSKTPLAEELDSARSSLVALYWVVVAGVTVVCAAGNPLVAAIILPGTQLLSSVLTAVVVLTLFGKGRTAALGQLGAITGRALLGAFVGVAAMVGITAFMNMR